MTHLVGHHQLRLPPASRQEGVDQDQQFFTLPVGLAPGAGPQLAPGQLLVGAGLGQGPHRAHPGDGGIVRHPLADPLGRRRPSRRQAEVVAQREVPIGR
jgi:hypothetical protein